MFCVHTVTRVVCMEWCGGWVLPPENQILTALELLVVRRCSFDNGERIEQRRESGEGREWGRLRDKTAGTGCLAGSRSYCALPKSLRHFAARPSSFSLTNRCQGFLTFFRSLSIWTSDHLLTRRCGLVWLLLCFIFWCCICHGTGVGMVVYLKKSLHSLLTVLKKKGKCWLTWRSLWLWDPDGTKWLDY